MLEWWEQIDRRELLLALRDVLAGGGCVVAEGRGRCGRPTAGRLCREFLAERGFSVVAVPPSPNVGSMIRDPFLRAWESSAPPVPVGQLGPWITKRRHITIAEIIDQIVNLTSSSTMRPAFIFEDVDETGPIAPHAVRQFAALASRVPCPVVVTSRSDAGTNWSASGDIRVQRLRSFDPTEVREFLALSSQLAELTTAELETLVQLMAPTEESTTTTSIEPDVVYDVLQALA